MTNGYEKKNIEDFGKTIPGIFTDEPNLEAALSNGAIMRWTPELWDIFQKRWGYDLKVKLPSLVEDTGNWKKIRHDYYEMLLELFIERWAKPWNKYCKENDLIWTGHYWEHGWPEPTDGLDEAAFYIWHQMPGVDMLGFRLDTAGLGGQFGNDRAIRELLSAANQAGCKRTLSETYGGGGWEINFEEQKRLVDWQFALGVNFVNLCLSLYSLNGVRKFDYPPSFSYHEPWWKEYRIMGDYIGRASLALSSGEQNNNTIVLQPNTSAWMYFSRKNKNPYINDIRNGFKNFVHQMEQNHVEYDLGSENVLKILGSVKGKTLRVGKRYYSLVVIPAEMENIDRTTFNLLTEYLENGGKVLSFRKQIPLLDGESSTLVDELIIRSGDKWLIVENLDDPKATRLLVRDEFSMEDKTKNGMLYHQRRVLDDGQILFIANSHQTKKALVEIKARGKYVSILNLITGKIYSYPSKTENGKICFMVDLEPAGSALFAITNQINDEPEFISTSGSETNIISICPLEVKRESENVLVVNYLDLKTARSEIKDIYFMNAMTGVFKENGVTIGDPWQHKIQYKKNYLHLDTLFKEDSGFEAGYHFYINKNLCEEDKFSIRAVIERPDLWTVNINGINVEKIEGSYWIDKDFGVFKVGPYLKPGKNTLKLRAPRMNIKAELMPVYFLGDFLIKPVGQNFEIAGERNISFGSWREAGLPFYSQKVAYTQTFNINKNEKANFKVKVNYHLQRRWL